MGRFVTGLFLCVLVAQSGLAQDEPVVVGGESFSKVFVGAPANGDKLMEFVREGEDFDNWTKLVGYRYQQLPSLGNEPKQAGIALYKTVKESNTDAKVGMMLNGKETEAVVHFLTWSNDGRRLLEFNVFRYVKSKDMKAVVSLQLAYRFSLDDANNPEKTEEIKSTQMALIREASTFDMKAVHMALAK